MKKISLILVTALLLTLFTGCAGNSASAPSASTPEKSSANAPAAAAEDKAPEVIWMCGTTSNLIDGEHPYYQALVYFDEELRKQSNNKYGLEIYTGGQLGSDLEVLDGTLMGNYQFCISPAGMINNIDSSFGIYDLPYLFANSEHAYVTMDSEIGKEAFDSLETHGLVGLGYGDAGFSNLTASFQIDKPEDMKGMKIRTMEIPMQIEFFNLLGANATPMSMNEVYTALQQGTIDGHGNVNMGILANRIYEVNKYVSVTEHLFSPIIYVMNKDYFDGLSAEDQAVIKKAAADSIQRQRVEAQRQNEKALKTMETEFGVTVTYPDKKPFMEVADQMYQNHPEYQDLVARVHAMEPKS